MSVVNEYPAPILKDFKPENELKDADVDISKGKKSFSFLLIRFFKLNDGVKLGIFATTNPASYQASNDLNEDLQSRFSIWKWNYPNVRQERKAIQWRGVDTSIQKGIMLLAKNTRDFVEQQKLSYALSTRDIQKFIDAYVSYEEDSVEILRLCLDMNVISFYDEVGEISTVKSRIESAFGSNIFTAKGDEALENASDEEL